MSAPVFTPFTERWYARLPDMYRDADPATGWTLKRFMSLIGDQANEIEVLFDRLLYIEPNDGGPATGLHSTSDLANPATADLAWLPWLAQLINVTIDAEAPVPTQRALMAGRVGGRNGGTVPDIIAVAQPYLLGTAPIIVTQFVGDQWHYTVTVYSHQVEGGTFGDLDAHYPTFGALDTAFATFSDFPSAIASLEAALQAQVPAGMVMTFVIVTTSLFGDLDAHFATFGAIDTTFATFAGVDAWSPP